MSAAAPRITSDFPQILVVSSGRRVELPCAAVGPPTPDVYWTNEESEHVGSSQPGTLILRPHKENIWFLVPTSGQN